MSKRIGLLAVVGCLCGCLFLLQIFGGGEKRERPMGSSEGAGSSHSELGPQVSTTGPGQPETLVGAGGRRLSAEASTSDSGEEVEGEERVFLVDGFLERVRKLTSSDDFHGLAWNEVVSTQRDLSQLVEEWRTSEWMHLREAVEESGDHVLVRGAGIVLMGQSVLPELLSASVASPGLSDFSSWLDQVCMTITDGSPELERAKWIALGLRRQVSEEPESQRGTAIPLGEFKAHFPTYPAIFSHLASSSDRDHALSRLGQRLPPEADQRPWTPEIKQEAFSRQLVVLSTFGPGAGKVEGDTRQLLDWMRPSGLEETVLTAPAAFALAHASRGSDDIAQRFLEAIRGQASSYALDYLHLLAKFGGHDNLVIGEVDRLFRGGKLKDWEKVLATDLLTELMTSESEAVAEQALGIVMDELFAPDADPYSQLGLFLSLSESGHGDFVQEAMAAKLDTTTDPTALWLLAPNIAIAGQANPAVGAQLFSLLLEKPQLDVKGFRIVLNQIKYMGGEEAIALLSGVAASHEDEGLRALAQKHVDALLQPE